ncbi:phage tail protein [Acinetobacter johnsonii]|uniref:phage tail protein n=1 Tax=Acinetobacter johnsonii TaxID=40214 RepID=UPI0032B5F3F6
MAEYYNVTTNLGDAEIANAIATNTKLDITHVAFGDGNGSVPTPTKTRTSLVREVHRQAVTKYERHATNANWIVIETIIPSDIGGFTIREIGIIANGKLISHGSHAPFEKVADPSGVSEYRLRFTQNVTDGSVVELTLDESLIYATQAWIDENYIKRSEIVDNLTTDDADKVASARTVKELKDNKLEKNDLKDASADQKGVVKLNNTLTSTSTTQALTAAQGKVLNDKAFGVSQSSKSVTLISGTTYTNTKNKPITIAVATNGSSSNAASITINGIQLFSTNSSGWYCCGFTVGVGESYKVTGGGISAIEFS